MNKSRLIFLRVLLIASAVVFAVALTFNILTVFRPDFFGGYTTLMDFIGLVVSLVFAISFLLILRIYISYSTLVRELSTETSYTLGHPLIIYNLHSFKRTISRLSRRRWAIKKKQYVICFTPSSSETSLNYASNDNTMTLNYEIATWMAKEFGVKKGPFNRRNIIYGFNRGIFLLFYLGDKEDGVKELVRVVMNNVYRIVDEKSIKVWAQPFFGVREFLLGENLTSAIEDAFIARNLSESNFESYTIFRKNIDNANEKVQQFQEIQQALANDEFVPYYQPKFSLKEKKFVGCEVLARWNSPTRGILTPGAFIDQAEQAGVLPAIDMIMFEKGLKDISDNLKRGRRVIPCSFNFSLYEFFSHNFLDTVLEIIHRYNVPPKYIEIEITETTSQVNQFISLSVIKKLKEMGIRVLMDDYGTGYSQIDNLKKIPFDAIKIDKSFTDFILTDEKTKSIVKFLIELGHINDMEVIIEGVEKKEQVDVLRRMHIDTIQGFYYSKALSNEDYHEFLKHNNFEKEVEQ